MEGELSLGFPDRNQDGPACSLAREADLESLWQKMPGGNAAACFSFAGNHMFLHHSSPPPPLEFVSRLCEFLAGSGKTL